MGPVEDDTEGDEGNNAEEVESGGISTNRGIVVALVVDGDDKPHKSVILDDLNPFDP